MPKETAQRVLLENGIAELPVKIYPLCEAYGITLKLTKPFRIRKSMGLAGVVRREPYVLIDPSYSLKSQRFTAAHELGHLLLGHVGSWRSVSKDGSEHNVAVMAPYDRGRIEPEADSFAEEVTMPECVLMACGVKTVRQVKKMCNILPTDSKRVVERVRERIKSGIPFTQTEQQIVEQFADYIRSHTTKEVRTCTKFVKCPGKS